MRYHRSKEVIANRIASTSEKPGDGETIFHPFDNQSVSGCVTDAQITLSGKLMASVNLLQGYTPPLVGFIEYRTVRQVLTGNGTFTVPQGVKSLQVVLIEEGLGGTGGAKGEPGESPREYSFTSGQYKTFGYAENLGGKGGAHGIGGKGGKILRIEVAVAEGQILAYSAGAGSPGGNINAGAGVNPVSTTFGAFNSSLGTANDSGYYDPITGETFAVPGAVGISGGDGAGGVWEAKVFIARTRMGFRKNTPGEALEEAPPLALTVVAAMTESARQAAGPDYLLTRQLVARALTQRPRTQ